MNKNILRTLAVSVSLAFSAGAAAEVLSKTEYKAAKDRIAAEYKSDRAACASQPSDAKSRCYTDAKSKQKAARAELAAGQKPSKAAPMAAKKESPQAYVDDAMITTKVKAAVLGEASLKSAEINVETYKGIVQLTGFVRSRTDINKAVEVARKVAGVASVKNDMIVKGQQ